MKKRLSLLMAALMIVTMLPMSAFAASKHNVTVASIEDLDAKSESTVTFLVDELQVLNSGKVAFELVNAKLAAGSAAGKYAAPVVAITKGDGTSVNVQAIENPVKPTNFDVVGKTGTDIDTDQTFIVQFPDVAAPQATDKSRSIQFTLKMALNYKDSSDGDVILKVQDLGADNSANKDVNIGTQDVKIAIVRPESKALTVTAKTSDDEISYDGGKVSRFEIKNFDDKKAKNLAIELDRDDYYAFDLKETKVVIDGQSFVANTLTNDGSGYVIYLNESQFRGKKFITVIPEIEKMGRSASEGNVNVSVRTVNNESDPKTNPPTYVAVSLKDYLAGKYKTVASDSANIGKVVDFKVTMKVVEKGKKEIPSVWGGEEATVEVTLKGPKGSFSNRGVEFETKDADVISVTPRKHTPGNASVLNVDGVYETRGLAGVDPKNGEAIYRDGKFVITGTTDQTTEFMFEMRVRTDHDVNGTATITAAQRGWETTADLVKITPKFTLSTETTDMKKSEVKENAKIVITEAKEGLLRTNESITLLFNTTRDYIEFTKAAKVEATNGMAFGSPKLLTVGGEVGKRSSGYVFEGAFDRTKNIKGESKAVIAMELPIKKQSRGGAAVITISGVNVKVDGSTVDGTYKVHAGLNGYTVASADYVKVVKEYGLEPILTVFTIGQTQYTVNGKPMTAASAPYVKNGRTMLPVRALAESLGLHVQWNGATKTATFTDSTKVAAVVIGADTMYINGTPVKLSAKAEIVNGTTFIELRSLATVFGVQIDWDAAAKTATVSK